MIIAGALVYAILVIGVVLAVACAVALWRQHRALEAARAATGRVWERGLTRFNAVSDILPDILVELDPDRSITFTNRAFFEITGYGERDMRCGPTLMDLVVPWDRPRLERAFALIRDDRPVLGLRCHLRDRSGSPVPILVDLHRAIESGTFAGWRGLLRVRAREDLSDVREVHASAASGL